MGTKATDNLDKVLDTYGENGYVLVSTELALNKYNQQVMYLFFTKEEYDEVDVYVHRTKLVNTAADENEDIENLTCGGNCCFARSGNLLPCCKYQGNRKQLGIARCSRTDCTWELHQYIFFEEVQREGGIRWALSLMNQRCIPAISVGSSGRWKRCTNLGTGE